MTKKEYMTAAVLAAAGMAAYSFEWYLLWGIVIFLLAAWLVKSIVIDA
jgi:hypothetical protein